MPKVDERIQALEAKLKQLKVLQQARKRGRGWGRRLAVRAAVKPSLAAADEPSWFVRPGP